MPRDTRKHPTSYYCCASRAWSIIQCCICSIRNTTGIVMVIPSLPSIWLLPQMVTDNMGHSFWMRSYWSWKKMSSHKPVLMPYLHRYLFVACWYIHKCCNISKVNFHGMGISHLRQIAGRWNEFKLNLPSQTLPRYDHLKWLQTLLSCFRTSCKPGEALNFPCRRTGNMFVQLLQTAFPGTSYIGVKAEFQPIWHLLPPW